MTSFFYQQYFFIFLFFFISILLSFILLKANPYEDARQAFDVRFYLVSILFIIFDLEAMYLFPWVISLNQIGLSGFWIMIDFLIELSIGLIYAWRIGSLEWE